MIKKILKNQTGMSLLEVTIAGAIAVGIGLGTVKLVENANKGAVKVKTDTELGELKNYIKSALTRNNNCRNTFASIPEPGNEDNTTTHLLNMFNPSTTTPSGDPVLIPDKINFDDPSNPKYYGLIAGTLQDTDGNVLFSIATGTDDATTKSTLILERNERVPGYPNWFIEEIRVYEMSNKGRNGNLNAGICPVYFSFSRDPNLNSQRALGATNKSFWIHLSCTTVSPSDGTMQFCVEDQAISLGHWEYIDPDRPEDGIEYAAGNVQIGQSAATADLILTNGNMDIQSGDIYVGGDVQITSDKRLKEKEEVISNATQKLDEMSGYYYFLRQDILEDRKLSKRKQVGVMAQEVEKVFPEAVKTKEDGYKSVNYMKLIPLLIQAHKEQEEKIKLQQKHLLILSRKINELEQRK